MIVDFHEDRIQLGANELPYDISHHIASIWLASYKKKLQYTMNTKPFPYSKCILSHINDVIHSPMQTRRFSDPLLIPRIIDEPLHMFQEETCFFKAPTHTALTLLPPHRLRQSCNSLHQLMS